MTRTMRGTAWLAMLLWLSATGLAQAEVVLDQSHVVPAGATGDLAIITVQSLAQAFTVGVEGVLTEIDLQIYKNTGTTGDITLTIRTTTDGVPDPDDSLVLFEDVISLDDIPTIDNVFLEVPFTPVDVSSAGIAVAPGDMLAVSLSREGAGSPPWATWRQNGIVYDGGFSFQRANSSQSWSLIPGFYAGFQTYVDDGQ